MSTARSLAAKRSHYCRRILAAWSDASPEHLRAGIAWYDRARDAAQRIHPNVLVGAGVIAALSPRTAWGQNVKWAERVCNAALAGHSVPPMVSTAERNGKAWAIAHLDNPSPDAILAILRGPKTCRFFRNITGDTHAVTIDVWAAWVATGRVTRVRSDSHGRQYETLEEAYQMAAEQLGVPARDVQAAVWVSARGTAE
jgi:hypothetical protein